MSRIFFDMMCLDHSKKSLGGFSEIKSRNFDFWGFRKKAFTFSSILVVISLILVFTKGSKLFSVDFTGGNAIHYNLKDDKTTAEQFQARLSESGFKSPRVVVKNGSGGVRDLEIVVSETNADFQEFKNETDNIKLYAKIDAAVRGGKTAEEMPKLSQQTVGGVVGAEFRSQALWAILWSVVAIFLYISLRFEATFAIGAVVALIHDIIISVGFLAAINHQISLPVIAALLTIMGYSLNDTIVIYDRMRENSGQIKKKSLFEIMNSSINDTLSRTVITSGTTVIVVLILAIFGGGEISDFAAVLSVGVIIGTYSSIFVAAPIVCSSSKASGQMSKIHEETIAREQTKKNDQTVMVD